MEIKRTSQKIKKNNDVSYTDRLSFKILIYKKSTLKINIIYNFGNELGKC